jgi:acetyl esterase/lipase
MYRCALPISLPLIVIVFFSSARAQPPAARPGALVPSEANVAYDQQDPSQKLDVYLAKSDTPTPVMVYFHGGGWRGGSKAPLPGWLGKACSEGWLSVVAVEYRFTNVAPHPAQVNDCLRAIQFVRHHAKQWNINAAHLGVTGGSAGGHLSLWVALHDDAAIPNSDDPVQRESSRVTCAVSFAGPTDWSLLNQLEHKHPAYRQLLGFPPETSAAALPAKAKVDVSPISFVTSDDPPVLQVHGDKDDIVPLEHAKNLDQRLKAAGVRSELLVIPGGNHGVAGAGIGVQQSRDFVHALLVP